MTPERFVALADAYGGALHRWPWAERDAARALLRNNPEMRAVLEPAAGLDDLLALWTVQEPAPALSACIAAAVTGRDRQARRLRLWFSSLGVAATLACGLAAGMGVVMARMPYADQAVGQLYELSVLGAPLDIREQPASDGGR